MKKRESIRNNPRYDLERKIVNENLEKIDLRLVTTTDYITKKTVAIVVQWITPILLFIVAGLIQVLPNPMILLSVVPPLWLFAILFCWNFQLNKYIRITMLQLRRIQLEDRIC